jgi:hypothetical protein
VLAVTSVPLALSVVADQVPVVTAVSIILAGVALLSSAATLVLASGVGCRVADEPAPAVTAVVAGIALEACVCSADILAESNPANRAHAKYSESAAGRSLEHRTATGLISDNPGYAVKGFGVHSSLLNQVHYYARNCTHS